VKEPGSVNDGVGSVLNMVGKGFGLCFVGWKKCIECILAPFPTFLIRADIIDDCSAGK
jgi:hypothetical protein